MNKTPRKKLEMHFFQNKCKKFILKILPKLHNRLQKKLYPAAWRVKIDYVDLKKMTNEAKS